MLNPQDVFRFFRRAIKSVPGDGKMWQLLSSTPVLGIALQPLYLLASLLRTMATRIAYS